MGWAECREFTWAVGNDLLSPVLLCWGWQSTEGQKPPRPHARANLGAFSSPPRPSCGGRIDF
jgi:hypothetical protein